MNNLFISDKKNISSTSFLIVFKSYSLEILLPIAVQ